MSIVVEEISNGLVIKKGNSYRIRAIFIGLAIVSFYLVLILPIAYKLIENPELSTGLLLFLITTTFAVVIHLSTYRFFSNRTIVIQRIENHIFLNGDSIGELKEVVISVKRVSTELGNYYYSVFVVSKGVFEKRIAYHLSHEEVLYLSDHIKNYITSEVKYTDSIWG